MQFYFSEPRRIHQRKWFLTILIAVVKKILVAQRNFQHRPHPGFGEKYSLDCKSTEIPVASNSNEIYPLCLIYPIKA